jgi:hypothetical protein
VKRWKIWKKSKLNSEKIWKIQKKRAYFSHHHRAERGIYAAAAAAAAIALKFHPKHEKR